MATKIVNVAHHSKLHMIVIDVPDEEHDQELAFWQGATGQPLTRVDAHPEYHGALLPGQRFGLLIQRLGDGPGRVHLDIHTDDLDAEVTRLERLGAKRLRHVHGWWIMQDPAGLPFCVIPVEPGSLDGGNAQRWD